MNNNEISEISQTQIYHGTGVIIYLFNKYLIFIILFMVINFIACIDDVDRGVPKNLIGSWIEVIPSQGPTDRFLAKDHDQWNFKENGLVNYKQAFIEWDNFSKRWNPYKFSGKDIFSYRIFDGNYLVIYQMQKDSSNDSVAKLFTILNFSVNGDTLSLLSGHIYQGISTTIIGEWNCEKLGYLERIIKRKIVIPSGEKRIYNKDGIMVAIHGDSRDTAFYKAEGKQLLYVYSYLGPNNDKVIDSIHTEYSIKRGFLFEHDKKRIFIKAKP
jgi:hypothetical protein